MLVIVKFLWMLQFHFKALDILVNEESRREGQYRASSAMQKKLYLGGEGGGGYLTIPE